MEKYQLTPEAVSDLLEICDFISQDNPEAADRVEDAVLRACDLLASSPFSWSRQERSDSLASPLLGGATVFDVLNRLRPCEEAAPNHPNPPWCPRSSVCAHVMLLSAHPLRSPCVLTGFSARLLFPPEV